MEMRKPFLVGVISGSFAEDGVGTGEGTGVGAGVEIGVGAGVGTGAGTEAEAGAGAGVSVFVGAFGMVFDFPSGFPIVRSSLRLY